MKSIILIIALGMSVHASAQVNNSIEADKPVRTLEQVESSINSIKVKMELVQANAEEDSIARAQGWYDQMNAQLDALNAERDQLMGVQPKKYHITKEEWSTMPREKQEYVLNHPETYTIEK